MRLSPFASLFALAAASPLGGDGLVVKATVQGQGKENRRPFLLYLVYVVCILKEIALVEQRRLSQ